MGPALVIGKDKNDVWRKMYSGIRLYTGTANCQKK
jgi:hypothetical protein